MLHGGGSDAAQHDAVTDRRAKWRRRPSVIDVRKIWGAEDVRALHVVRVRQSLEPSESYEPWRLNQ